MIRSSLFSGCIVMALLFSCRNATPPTYTTDRVVVRLEQEPTRINPILASSAFETAVHEYIFVSLADYDPVSLEMVPVLIKEMPIGTRIGAGPYKGGTEYKVEILDDAVWADGSPITGYDLEFTLKVVNHPGVQCPNWKTFLKDIVQIDVDRDNPRQFSVLTIGNYFLNKEAFLSTELYPAYFYDPDDRWSQYTLGEIRNSSIADSLISSDDVFTSMALDFSKIEYSKTQLQGAGPYNLIAWETGQFIILERKDEYWGSAYPDRTYLQASPRQIIFQIIEDNATAITQLKSGQIDVISLMSSQYQSFDDLKKDSLFADQFLFERPGVMQFYYVLLNNADIRLREKEVRKALNQLMNVDRMIDLLEGGAGTRMNSFIHPSKAEYNSDLTLYDYNPAAARSLLESAGWIDTDGNGIRDKEINDKREELSLRFFITGSTLSESISNLLKESAAEVGIEIEAVEQKHSITLPNNIRPGDFEMTTLRTTQAASRVDPMPGLHSSSIGEGGSNYSRFSNEDADRLIDIIRTSLDEEERFSAYMKLQEIYNEECPVIFLYAPVERFVISNQIDPILSAKRPGCFVNALKAVNL